MILGKPETTKIETLIERASEALERRTNNPFPIAYAFNPDGTMTLAEVITLLRILNIGVTSDQYTHDAFPPALRRHFTAVAI